MHSVDVTTTAASNQHAAASTPMFSAAIRLAAFLSVVAAVVVIALDSLVDLSAGAVVASVAGVGFATSWVVTGRLNERPIAVPVHRVAVVPLPHRV